MACVNMLKKKKIRQMGRKKGRKEEMADLFKEKNMYFKMLI